MSERTVAEIMGWTVHNPHRWPGGDPGGDVLGWTCSECGEWVDDGAPRTECASAWNQHPKPTADDMLAWLRERGWQFHAHGNVATRDVTWYLTEFGSVRETPIASAPTLHAALETAVRAVAEAGDE